MPNALEKLSGMISKKYRNFLQRFKSTFRIAGTEAGPPQTRIVLGEMSLDHLLDNDSSFVPDHAPAENLEKLPIKKTRVELMRSRPESPQNSSDIFSEMEWEEKAQYLLNEGRGDEIRPWKREGLRADRRNVNKQPSIVSSDISSDRVSACSVEIIPFLPRKGEISRQF